MGLLEMESREYVMRGLLSRAAYDYVLIDCPPSLNILTVNALTVANTVLIPMQCEYHALEGLSASRNNQGLKGVFEPQLDIEGLVRTMYDSRISLPRDVSRQLVTHFGEKLFRTVIPRNIKLAEAPSHGQPVIEYDRSSKGSRAFGSGGGITKTTRGLFQPVTMTKKNYKGLDALLSTSSADFGINTRSASKGLTLVSVNKITPSPYQPRREFDETKLEELASWSKESWTLAASCHQDTPDGSGADAGERRLRQAHSLDWMNTGLVENVSDKDASAFA